MIILVMKFSNKSLIVLKHLRLNARKNFSDIGRETGIPVTTVFDNYQRLANNKIITKHASLLDYRKLGYFYRSFVFVKTRQKKELYGFLDSHQNVNSIFRISNYDYMVDTIFPTIKEFHAFLDLLQDFDLQKLECHDVIEHVKKEEFFC
jgi:DNA-binding Lrp family transcriptional regulator